MKGRSVSKLMVFFLVLALCFLFSGIFLGIWIYRDLGPVLTEVEHHASVLRSVQNTAFYSMVCGGLTISGVAILVVICELKYKSKR